MKRRAIFVLLCCALSLRSADNKADKKADKKKDPTEIGDRNVAGRFNNFYSIDKELALGRQLAIEVRKQARVIDDPIVSEYFNRMCQNLARNSDVTFPVTCTLLDSAEVNAFTLPGGFVFVNTGMFRLSDNEAELASVLAHELGHAAARHATRQATRNDLLAASTIPLSVLADGWDSSCARPQASLSRWRFSIFRVSSNRKRICSAFSTSGNPATIPARASICSSESNRPSAAAPAASPGCFVRIR